jgi:hypothetical protein
MLVVGEVQEIVELVVLEVQVVVVKQEMQVKPELLEQLIWVVVAVEAEIALMEPVLLEALAS